MLELGGDLSIGRVGNIDAIQQNQGAVTGFTAHIHVADLAQTTAVTHGNTGESFHHIQQGAVAELFDIGGGEYGYGDAGLRAGYSHAAGGHRNLLEVIVCGISGDLRKGRRRGQQDRAAQ